MTVVVIEHLAEPVKTGYSILRETVWIDGEQEWSVVLGSPAPTSTVKQHEKTVTLGQEQRPFWPRFRTE